MGTYIKGSNIKLFALIFVSLLILPLIFRNPFFLRIATEALMWIGLAISWDIIGGYTGRVNFGHGAFFGIGAYITAILMMEWGWAFLPTLPIAGFGAGLVAFIIGFPTLRLMGAYFAIAMWSLALAFQQLALLMNITGGPDGMRLPTFLNPEFFFYLMLVMVMGTFVLLWYLMECASFGFKVRSIREDESGAMALGLNPTRIKIQAFVLSAVPAGLIGGIYAYWVSYIDPPSVFGDIITDQAIVMTILGGMGTLIGPAIGAVILFAFKTVFWAYLSDYQVLYLIILGVVIALTVFFLPNGVWGTINSYLDHRKSKKMIH
jgi:branched-chain amino acid transport system permease protein